mmetsp:Transcript_37850/g.55745  ORF Transcript_37850/g.55745 Transcript_37850/m.55745 type:complete len:157 (-) Transcript_37850:228-698(-)
MKHAQKHTPKNTTKPKRLQRSQQAQEELKGADMHSSIALPTSREKLENCAKKNTQRVTPPPRKQHKQSYYLIQDDPIEKINVIKDLKSLEASYLISSQPPHMPRCRKQIDLSSNPFQDIINIDEDIMKSKINLSKDRKTFMFKAKFDLLDLDSDSN